MFYVWVVVVRRRLWVGWVERSDDERMRCVKWRLGGVVICVGVNLYMVYLLGLGDDYGEIRMLWCFGWIVLGILVMVMVIRFRIWEFNGLVFFFWDMFGVIWWFWGWFVLLDGVCFVLCGLIGVWWMDGWVCVNIGWSWWVVWVINSVVELKIF